jgi:hypothetical protein
MFQACRVGIDADARLMTQWSLSVPIVGVAGIDIGDAVVRPRAFLIFRDGTEALSFILGPIVFADHAVPRQSKVGLVVLLALLRFVTVRCFRHVGVLFTSLVYARHRTVTSG